MLWQRVFSSFGFGLGLTMSRFVFRLASVQDGMVIAAALVAIMLKAVARLGIVSFAIRGLMIRSQTDGAQFSGKDLFIGFFLVNRDGAGTTEMISSTEATILLALLICVVTMSTMLFVLLRLFGRPRVTFRPKCCNIGTSSVRVIIVTLPMRFILIFSIGIGIHQSHLGVILSQSSLMC